MALLSISAAARAAGKDRGTIQRYIKDGRLSVSKDAADRPQIDTAELMRVFGALKTDGSNAPAADNQHDTAGSNTMQQFALEALREQLKAAQEREDWLKKQLEEAQAHNRELERRMLPPAEELQEKGFFARLFS